MERNREINARFYGSRSRLDEAHDRLLNETRTRLTRWTGIFPTGRDLRRSNAGPVWGYANRGKVLFVKKRKAGIPTTLALAVTLCTGGLEIASHTDSSSASCFVDASPEASCWHMHPSCSSESLLSIMKMRSKSVMLGYAVSDASYQPVSFDSSCRRYCR